MRKIAAVSVMMLLMVWNVSFAKKKSNLPLSKQASLVESYSPSEVTIKATGLGGKTGFFRNDRVKNAMLDLKKAAVYFVLFNGTDPLLSTQDSKDKFSGIAEEFFKDLNVNKYISWESDKVISSVNTTLPDKEKGKKITKMVRVNKKALTDYLVSQNIMVSQSELASAIGLPFIMVIPETPKGQTPLQVFDKNPLAKQAAAAIESYLTARKYDVVVPRASEQLNDMTKMQSEIKGAEEDVSYQLALALGSDIYIVFAGTVDPGSGGSKASVSVKAYETTTARLLGTETGYSKTRPGPKAPLVEEAVNDAIDKVLARVKNYWMDDVKKGLQYKLIFKMMGEFDEDEAEEIQEEVSDIMDEVFALSKENIVSDKTMDYLVWAKKDEFKKASKIYRHFKKKMEKTAKLKRININKKLIIIGVEEPE